MPAIDSSSHHQPATEGSLCADKPLLGALIRFQTPPSPRPRTFLVPSISLASPSRLWKPSLPPNLPLQPPVPADVSALPPPDDSPLDSAALTTIEQVHSPIAKYHHSPLETAALTTLQQRSSDRFVVSSFCNFHMSISFHCSYGAIWSNHGVSIGRTASGKLGSRIKPVSDCETAKCNCSSIGNQTRAGMPSNEDLDKRNAHHLALAGSQEADTCTIREDM